MHSFKKVFKWFCIVSGVSLLAAIASAQVAVDNFNPGADNAIQTFAVQPDGKILVGGAFQNMGGQPRACIARLNPDGSLDADFNPGMSGNFPQVLTLAVQPDGKILVGGNFTSLAGTGRNYIGRLNPDGSIDQDFNPDANIQVINFALLANGQILVSGPFSNIGGVATRALARLNAGGTLDTNFNAKVSNNIYTTAVQTDGRILIGGQFTNIGGVGRHYLARLNTDGSLDGTFNPAPNSEVAAIMVQPDGNILVGGSFTNLAGAPCAGIGRLTTNGAIDPSFNANTSGGSPTNRVYNFALQTDGQIVVGGNFIAIDGQSQTFLGRLNSNGSSDPSFAISATPGSAGGGFSLGSSVYALAIQPDGGILVGGSFTGLGGQTRNFLGRLTNSSTAAQTLALSPDNTTLTWNRSGSSTEVSSVTFESSSEGMTYNLLGYGTRITGGWQLGGLAIPSTQNTYLRARGQALGGYGDASVGIIESVIQVNASTASIGLNGPSAPGDGTFQFGFANANSNFTVLATTNLAIPMFKWTVLGPPTQVSPGHFQFTDTNASNFPARFYRVRSP